MGLGGYLVIEGQMTFGALFAFINLLNYVVNPLGSISQHLRLASTRRPGRASASSTCGPARRTRPAER